MTDEQPQVPPPEQPPENRPPQIRLSPQLYIFTAVVVIGSILFTLFIRNPYTQAVSGDYYESRTFDDGALWVAIFVGIPALWYGYRLFMKRIKMK